MKIRVGLAACVLPLWTACESTRIAPATSTDAPLEIDERRMWTRAREEQAILERSGFLLRDPQVESYLASVAARIQAPPLPEGGRLAVRVLVAPTLNAFAMPDGTIYLHSGMLAAIANEAQLAAVLSHEIVHAAHRHQLKSMRDLKNKTAFAASFSAGTAGVGSIFGVMGAAASLSGYAQELEREADETGFRLMAAAGYDMHEAPKVFEVMLAESARRKIREPFFFGSHPRLGERIASYQQLLAGLSSGQVAGRTGTDDYESHLVEVFARNAEAAQQIGANDAAVASGERARRLRPNDTRLLLLLADIRRKRDDDPAIALSLYERALQLDERLVPAHAGVALIAFKRGDFISAAKGFRRYLELKPDASDRAFIEDLLQQCAAPR